MKKIGRKYHTHLAQSYVSQIAYLVILRRSLHTREEHLLTRLKGGLIKE